MINNSSSLPNVNNTNNNMHELNGSSNAAIKLREVLEHNPDDTDISSLFSGDDGAPNYLFHDEPPADQYNDASNGSIPYKELATFTGHGNQKVICCDFSPDGKILASGGHDKKIVIWDVSKKSLSSTLSGHMNVISDVRFGPPTVSASPSSSLLASSSYDTIIRLWKPWDTEDPCAATLKGHTSAVSSVDFHPNKLEMLCSIDQDGDLKFWSMANATCTKTISKTVSRIARFQPIHGLLLAAGNDNKVKLFDMTSQQEIRTLQGHLRAIHSITWQPQTTKMVTGSEDCVAVWDVANPSRPLRTISFNKISCCGFHPTHRSVVVIGCYQRVYLWDFENDKTEIISAHDGIISGLSSSFVNGMFATASHDAKVKLFM
jgi:WD40 repeat protein